jgi:predicted transcriptional regulator of viral defense system
MDWVTAIRNEAQRSSLLHTDELARKYKIVPVAVTQALSRQEQRGLVEHISSKIYFNLLAPDATPRELVNVLRERAYISLDSALRKYGISTQSPQVLTCVTTERPREFNARTIRISYRGISPRLYWGYQKQRTRYGSYQIAEPEKALLDWIYLNLQNGVEPAFDELDFGSLSRRKLVEYAERFPSTVHKHLLPVLATEKFLA